MRFIKVPVPPSRKRFALDPVPAAAPVYYFRAKIGFPVLHPFTKRRYGI
jgi:hypothetical protein